MDFKTYTFQIFIIIALRQEIKAFSVKLTYKKSFTFPCGIQENENCSDSVLYSIHPSSIICSVVGGVEPIPEAAYTLDKLPIHHRACDDY